MKTGTKGAWIIHHANKLSTVTNVGEFEGLQFAGRCGVLLSSISANQQTSLDNARVEALAKVAGINTKLELPAILAELDKQKLIQKGQTGVEVLGLTTVTTLEHTASIFEQGAPNAAEKAALLLSETASELPTNAKDAAELIEDRFKLSGEESAEFFTSAEEIGFVDVETVGRLILASFASAPFPHPARAEGHIYDKILYTAKEHYSDNTVALFIPKGFRETERVDFVVHFHGWRNTVAGTLGTFHLIEQLVASGKNAVLVVPEGPHDAPDSFGGKLEDADGFKRFMDEVVATLRERASFQKKDFSAGRIILSGHSGGYHVIAGIVDRGGLSKNADEVWLFDALYGQTDSYLNWSDQTHGRLLNIYTDHGGTKDESEKLQSRLLARATAIYATEETALAAEKLKTNQFVFIHTDLAHDDVMAKRNEFELFLKISPLADR